MTANFQNLFCYVWPNCPLHLLPYLSDARICLKIDYTQVTGPEGHVSPWAPCMSRSPGADVQVTITGTQCDHNTSVSHVAKPQAWCQGERQGERWGSPTLTLHPFSLSQPLGEKTPTNTWILSSARKRVFICLLQMDFWEKSLLPVPLQGESDQRRLEIVWSYFSPVLCWRPDTITIIALPHTVSFHSTPAPTYKTHTCTCVHAHANYPLML